MNSFFFSNVFSSSLTRQAGRLLAIVLAMRLSPGVMTVLDLLLCMIASIVLVCLKDSGTVDQMTSLHPAAALWACSAIIGVGFASIFPSAYHLVEHFVDVTGRYNSVLMLSNAHSYC